MPEGPSILIAKETLAFLKGKKIIEATGASNLDYQKISNQKITAINSWGKHLLICFKDSFVRIHLLMFGTYSINERKELIPKLRLQLDKDEISFYTCSVKQVNQPVQEVYDWERDIMSDQWNKEKALTTIQEAAKHKVCDLLLDQEIFSGVGNIIKNEALFRARIHPNSMIEAIPKKKLQELIREARDYSFDFYKWKKEGVLKRKWLVYQKTKCPVCSRELIKKELGKSKRWSFYCSNCQVKY